MNYESSILKQGMYQVNCHIFSPKESTSVINKTIVAYGQKFGSSEAGIPTVNHFKTYQNKLH